jgi:hypothetical protein
VQFVEKKYPEFLPNLSTARSPMSMFAAVIKEIYRDRLPGGRKRHYHVALMPCTAKKFEAKRGEFVTEAGPNTDDVITTLARGITHDNDVENADAAGYLRGRNEKIEAVLHPEPDLPDESDTTPVFPHYNRRSIWDAV